MPDAHFESEELIGIVFARARLMPDQYAELVHDISQRYGLSLGEIEKRVESRRARFAGCLTRRGAARMLAAQSQLEYILGIRHVAGLELTDAVAAAIAEASDGHLATLGYWPHPHEDCVSIASRYVQAIDTIIESRLNSSISIKLDRLEFNRDAVFQVFRHAKLRNVCVHFDAESLPSTDRVLSFVEKGLEMGTDLSTTLPSRWQRSSQDAERLIALGVPFRIVKGQGTDPDSPDIDPRRSFLDLVKQVAGRASHVAVATHDRRVAEPALDLLLATGTPCSLEQLRFLPRLDFLAARRGVPVRVYVPYGRPGLPYTLAQVARRPAILLWVVRDLTVGSGRQIAIRSRS
jgi:proline dehydrogenase